MLLASDAPSLEYVKTMKDLGAVVEALTAPGAAENFELAKRSADRVKTAMPFVEKFWLGKDTGAQRAAQAATKAAGDLAVVAALSSVEGVEAAVKDLTAACATCHAAHREDAGDGSFRIK